MTLSDDDNPFGRLLQRIEPDSTLLRAWPLTGGISAQVTALEFVRSGGQRKRLVVRRPRTADVDSRSLTAADEFTLLQRLHSAGLATPEPCRLATSGEIFSTPFFIMEYVEGTPGFDPAPRTDAIDSFAGLLARIHALDRVLPDVSFLPQQAERIAAILRRPPMLTGEGASDEGRIREALRSVWPVVVPYNPAVLLHGDYWPGNTLWNDGRLVAVIDWEDAALGDPLADVANSRLEIFWDLGSDAMERFTQHYRFLTRIDFTHLPVWDLCAALGPARTMSAWGLDAPTEQTMRAGLQRFVTQAIATLPGHRLF